MKNEFVTYLNTLHSGDANNKGALAEAQAREPLFALLQVDHPWANDIFEALTSDEGRSVVLSGHAGDGKSTIAIEVLRRLHSLDKTQLLPEGLKKIESVNFDGRVVTVVKDLSECTDSDRDIIFRNLMSGERYLLISNTGTLLDFFKKRNEQLGKSIVEIENDLLSALDSSRRVKLDMGSVFDVYNLAQYDNVALAIKFLGQLIDSPEWDKCSECSCKDVCPVLRNRNLIGGYRSRVLQRIHLLYFRTYAYGERLTMRQISAHFSYMITSGLGCEDISHAFSIGDLRKTDRYLFINRFWGDDGRTDDPGAYQMKAIRVFSDQHLNSQYSPTLERKFWDAEGGASSFVNIPALKVFAEELHKRAMRVVKPQDSVYARREWRRLIFFFYEPDPLNPDAIAAFDKFRAAFLDSPMLLKFRQWQVKNEEFKAKAIQPALFSVLQEEFCGILPPEGSSQNKDLYITLRRKSPDIKQSAQLVLRRLNFVENFKVQMGGSGLNVPVLMGQGALSSIRLALNLPFLDYIVTRKEGEIGRGLNLSYRDRLEKLMAQIVYRLPERESDGLLILRQQEDGKLSTVSVNVTSEGLEVNND